MHRPQFTLKTLLWLMAVVAAFFAGAAWQRHQLAEERLKLEAANRALKEENAQLYHKWQDERRPGK